MAKTPGRILAYLITIGMANGGFGYTMHGENLSHVPPDIPASHKTVDLENNIISDVDITRLAHLTNLETIILKKNKIVTFPNFNTHNGTLKKVDISDNLITVVNETLLSKLSALEGLCLSHNYLLAITIPDMRNLIKLEIGNNNGLSELGLGICPKLAEIHAGYSRIQNIILDQDFNYNATTKILLQHNGMTNLPSNLKGFSRLGYLDISNNNFAYISPIELSELTQLEILVINGNSRLEDLVINNLKNLTEVHAKDCGLEYIKITGTDNLVLLSMENSNLNQMPDFDDQSTDIQIMNLENNNLSFIPAQYFHLKGQLQELNLKGNHLTSFDGTHMIAVKILDLSYNALETFPRVIGGSYASLQILYLQYNNISNITTQDAFIDPWLFYSIPNNLSILDIAGNPLVQFPVQFLGNLHNLTDLHVYDMGLNGIPDVSMLPKLNHLDCHKNNISNLDSKHLELMPGIKTLKLEENAFIFLTDLRVIMETLDHMTLAIYLSGNSLHCSPELCWMLEQTKNR